MDHTLFELPSGIISKGPFKDPELEVFNNTIQETEEQQEEMMDSLFFEGFSPGSSDESNAESDSELRELYPPEPETGEYEDQAESFLVNENQAESHPIGEDEDHFGTESEFDPASFRESQDEEMVTSFQNEFYVDDTKGRTLYLPVSAGKGLMAKTGIFIPAGFTPTREIDMVLYFHGHLGSTVNVNGNKKWVPNNKFQKLGIEYYWKNYSNIRDCFSLSSKNAILIAPTLGSLSSSQFGSFGQDYFMDEFISSCFKELKSRNVLSAESIPNRIIPAAHSGGGNPMGFILTRKNRLRDKIIEAWGFDCLYGKTVESSWIKNYDTWAKSNQDKFFYHFWAQYENYQPAQRGKDLQKLNPKNVKNIAPPKFIAHQDIIEYAWKNNINDAKHTWFDPINAALVTGSKEGTEIIKNLLSLKNSAEQTVQEWKNLSPEQRSIFMMASNPNASEQQVMEMALTQQLSGQNELTNLIFYNRHKDYLERKLDTTGRANLQDEWNAINSRIVLPFLRNKQFGPGNLVHHRETFESGPGTTLSCQLVPITYTFKKVSFIPSKIISKGASESPYDFTRKTLKKVNQDPDEWFRNFTQISFLGVNFNNPIHIQLAQLLKDIENRFIQDISPNDRNMEVVRKQLGLETELIAGARKSPTAALKSMHLFGLAIDVNYSGNPFVQNKDRKSRNAKTHQEFIIPSGVETINAVLNNARNLLGGNVNKFRYGLSYDEYKMINDFLVSYFKLIDNEIKLKEKLRDSAVAAWNTLSPETAIMKIQKDLDYFAFSVDRWGNRDRIKNAGFMNLTKALVQGLTAGGLDWGGAGYGDMMHFDMRSTGIGKCIHLAR